MLNSLLGEILLLRNRTAEAEPRLRKALTDQAGNPRVLNSLAECLRRSDRLMEAAGVEGARHIEGAEFGISNAM